MSETDSFINEVSEEVRRDRLYGYVRRYGWIAVLAVLLIVGGTAYNEYSDAQEAATAQAAGDAMLDALGQDDPEARAAALAEVDAQGEAVAVTDLLTAATQQEAGDLAAAKATLDGLAVNPDVPQIYRDVAGFKAALINLPDTDQTARRQTFEALSQPGAPFRLLALEQLAQMDVAAGETDAAITTLRAILEDAAVTRGLRERAQSLIVALGAELEQPAVAGADDSADQ
ncbi:hypothetical protein [Yoonia sp. 208BN28-4]|uniref:hypothetical protein n=1 Tax=Yoonia sp. 208BN28-4 TaxID=3126505 RepID=UPI0030A14C68